MSLRSKNSHPRLQQGMAIPLVLGVLTILAILILVITRAGSQTYTQSALAAYNIKARHYAFAAIEYANDVVHQNLADPTLNQIWKERLVTTLLNQQGELTIDLMTEAKSFTKRLYQMLDANSEIKDFTNPGGFQGGERITDFEGIEAAKNAGFELLQATVKFHNFKSIRFDTMNPSIYHDPSRYYRDRLGEQGGIAPIGDMIGFYTTHIKLRFGIVERELLITKDIKIINNEPIARNYALFSFGAPNALHSKNDLTSDGDLIIDANKFGRIRVMGPYYIDTEGYPKGTGNGTPVGWSYPTQSWDGYSFIPSPRGITTGGFSVKVERPEKERGTTMGIGIGSSGLLNFPFSGDPGFKGLPKVQNYWAASVPVGEQHFSITGPRNAFREYRGLLYQFGTDNKAPIGPFTGFDVLQEDMEARVEGHLIGNFSQINYEHMAFCQPISTYINLFSGLFGGGGTGAAGGGGTPPAGGTSNRPFLDEVIDPNGRLDRFAAKICDIDPSEGLSGPVSLRIPGVGGLQNLLQPVETTFHQVEQYMDLAQSILCKTTLG